MNYYNLKTLVLLKQDIKYEELYEKISKLISQSMLNNLELKELHEKNKYKNYTFCSLYPIEKNGTYKKGSLYTFDIRFLDLQFSMKIKQLLGETENSYFKVIMTNMETGTQRKINKLITLTPAVITTEKGDYKIDDDMNFVKERAVANIQKKYNQIYNEKIDIEFIKCVRKINLKPIKIPYKNINLLANKFEFEIKDDPMSQNLAYLALAIGILEKNAEGFGFCRAI